VTAGTLLLVICNPNNPTGTVMPASDMSALVKALPEHVTIIADEVYCDFVTDEAYPDTLAYVLQGYPIIRIQTFSKAYGMAGLRLGYAVAPAEIAHDVGGLHRAFHQNRLALAAGVAALADEAQLQKNVQTVLSYIPSQTNFIVVRLPQDSQAVAKALEPYGVIIRALNTTGLENCLRVSVSLPAGNQQFMRGLEELLSE
jgi:histidinol-phosphate aminotransferase